MLIHVRTQKGKGYKPAEDSGDKYHGVSKFNVTTGEQVKSKSNLPSYTKVFAETLIKHAEQDTKIIGITGAMPSGTGLNLFEKKFPERTFDVGIAEQHAVTFAAGLATEGYKPYAAIYSTFLQRAYDQLIHDVAVQNLDVTFALDRAVGACSYYSSSLARLTYSLFLLSIFNLSPTFINKGTLTIAPVSKVAGLVPPLTVLPFNPGSHADTVTMLKLAG